MWWTVTFRNAGWRYPYSILGTICTSHPRSTKIAADRAVWMLSA
jgi:hypothetical protein